jgi:hypothetical protein
MEYFAPKMHPIFTDDIINSITLSSIHLTNRKIPRHEKKARSLLNPALENWEVVENLTRRYHKF